METKIPFKYIEQFLNERNEFKKIITNCKDFTDPRAIIYIKFMISSVPNNEIRKNIRDKFDNSLREIDAKNLSIEDTAKEKLDLCMDILNDITEFHTNIWGYHIRQSVGQIK
jgi:regulator of RNase E activity RraB